MPTVLICPDADALRRMAEGDTPDEVAWSTALHLSECGRCAGLFDSFIGSRLAVAPATNADDSAVVAAVAARAKDLLDMWRVDSTFDQSRAASEPSAERPQPNHGPTTVTAKSRWGRFLLHEELGHGGMGAVYRATDTTLGRDVAVKVIKPRKGEDGITDDQKARFLREARAAAAVHHPNIVAIHDLGEHDGTPFIVMPLLSGQTLADRLKGGAILPPAEVARLGAQMADGLTAAHAARLVHRDLKPGNVWYDPRNEGTVQLLDFGLAKPTDDAADDITGGNALAGTPRYMAPEQAEGADPHPRADLFSVGIMLYEMLTGRPLFPKDEPVHQVLAKVRKFRRPPVADLLPAIPAGLAAVVHGLLHHDPKSREPGTAAALAAALRRPLDGSAPKPAPKPKRGRVWPLLLLATAFLGFVCVLAYQFIIIVKSDPKGPLVTFKSHPTDPGLGLQLPPGSTIDASKGDGTATILVPAKPTEVIPTIPKTPDTKPAEPKAAGPRFPDPPGGKLASLDDLKRDAIDPAVLKEAGFGDANKVPKEVVAAVKGHMAGVHALALHPNGYTLASAGRDGVLCIWRLVGQSIEAGPVLKLHENAVTAVAFSPDGKHMISGDLSGLVLVWETKTYTVIKKFKHPPEAVAALAVAPDSKQFVIGFGSENVRLFDLPTADAGTVIRGNRNVTQGVMYLPDGKSLLLGSNGLLRRYDLRKEEFTTLSSEGKVWYAAMALHPRKPLVAVQGALAPVDSKEKLRELLPGFRDNKDLGPRRTISVRDVGKEFGTLKRLVHEQRVERCGFSDDGTKLVTKTENGTISFWDWEGERLLHTVRYSDPNPPKAPDDTTGEKVVSEPASLAVHPDGRHAITGSFNGVLVVIRYSP